jgi:hypothetical protein
MQSSWTEFEKFCLEFETTMPISGKLNYFFPSTCSFTACSNSTIQGLAGATDSHSAHQENPCCYGTWKFMTVLTGAQSIEPCLKPVQSHIHTKVSQ